MTTHRQAPKGHSTASRGSVPNVATRAHDAAVAAVEARDARSDSPLTHLDLFSGIGGFALAARIAGFETVGFSEVDDYASKVLAKHWPKVKNYGDITTADFSGVGKVTVLTGGFPCQPYSVAGKRGGSGDDRALWPEMLRVIALIRPSWVIGENVAGIINMELDSVLTSLGSIGYSTRAFVVPACGVDARHRRERVWIMAHSEGVNGGAGCGEADSQCNGNIAGNGGEIMADTTSERLQRKWPARKQVSKLYGTEAVSLRNGCYRAIWPVEPDVCRVANGIPHRSHRLKGLGNAIVPQVALPFFDAIATLEFTWREPVRAVAAAGAHGRNFGSSETQAQND